MSAHLKKRFKRKLKMKKQRVLKVKKLKEPRTSLQVKVCRLCQKSRELVEK